MKVILTLFNSCSGLRMIIKDGSAIKNIEKYSKPDANPWAFISSAAAPKKAIVPISLKTVL